MNIAHEDPVGCAVVRRFAAQLEASLWGVKHPPYEQPPKPPRLWAIRCASASLEAARYDVVEAEAALELAREELKRARREARPRVAAGRKSMRRAQRLPRDPEPTLRAWRHWEAKCARWHERERKRAAKRIGHETGIAHWLGIGITDEITGRGSRLPRTATTTARPRRRR